MPRRILLAPLALVAALTLAAPAGAAVTTSSITTPSASPFFSPFVNESLPDTDPSRQLTIAGTADGADGDLVDIRCAYRRATGEIAYRGLEQDVTVTGGAFSATARIPGETTCRLAAVPDGASPADPAPFAGPVYFGAETSTETVGGIGPNAALVRNYFSGTTSPTMEADFTSIGDGGAPYDMAPIDATGALPQYAEYLFYGNAALYSASTKAGETRSQIRVDGINAFVPHAAAGLYAGVETAAGLPGVTIESRTLDPVTRDITQVVTEPVVTCPTEGGANITDATASVANCGSLRPSGVAIRRTIAIRNATRSVETTDRWVSTDGAAHAIDVLYDQYQETTSGKINGYRFPWVDGATSKTRAAGDEIAPPPGRVSTIFVKSDVDSPADDPRWTQGSVTVAPRPDLIRFTETYRFELGFKRTVPATGALTIEQRYTIGTKSTDVAAQAQTMEQRAAAGLAIAITSPTQVSGYDPSYTVSGSTGAVSGVKSVLVNGTAVTPKADGTWSLPIKLASGANALTATLTDDAGDSVTTTGVVTFAPGPAQATVLNAGVRKGVLSATLRCQTVPGATCAGRVRLTARITRVKKTKRGKRRSTKTVTLASRAYTLPSGDGAIRTVPLSKANRALVRKYRIKRATLTLTQTVGTFTKTTKTSVPVRL